VQQIAVLVFVVEDDASVQFVLQETLEDAGFSVIMASGGQEAVRLLEERGHELHGLITDVRLGDGLDGWQVARHAREASPDLPVVYISGDSAHQWAAHGVPGSIFIAKPFALAQVVIAISSLLNIGGPPLKLA
jgi:CheY-like chemotaxis protein